MLDLYLNKDITIKLPDNKKITEIKWLSVYDLSRLVSKWSKKGYFFLYICCMQTSGFTYSLLKLVIIIYYMFLCFSCFSVSRSPLVMCTSQRALSHPKQSYLINCPPRREKSGQVLLPLLTPRQLLLTVSGIFVKILVTGS